MACDFSVALFAGVVEMGEHLNNATAIWVGALLVCLTIVSLLLHGYQANGSAWLTAGLFALAGFKARLVILYFMDMRNGSKPWRIAFEVWLLLTTLGLIALTILI